MTRWTLYIITDEKFYWSTEFNGWMYPSHYWDPILKLLKQINSRKEFEAMLDKFNQENFEYPEDMVYEFELSLLIKILDFNKKYFGFRFSDWIFIKNLSERSYTFTLRNKKKTQIKLLPNSTKRFNFGDLE